MELCSVLCGSLDGRRWIHAYVWLSPFAVHLKLSQDCQSAIPQYKIKILKTPKTSVAHFRLLKRTPVFHLFLPLWLFHSLTKEPIFQLANNFICLNLSTSKLIHPPQKSSRSNFLPPHFLAHQRVIPLVHPLPPRRKKFNPGFD